MQFIWRARKRSESVKVDFLERRRQVLTRKATLTGSLVTVIFCIADSTINRTLFAPVMIFTLYNFLFFFLSGKTVNTLQRYIFFAALNLLISCLAFKQGSQTGIPLMLFPVMAYSLLIFNLKQYRHSFMCIVTSLGLFLYLQENKFTSQVITQHLNIASSFAIYSLLALILTVHYLYHFFMMINYALKSGDKSRFSLQSIIENTPDAILLLDKEWNVIEYNSVFQKWFKRITQDDFEKGMDICSALKKLENTSQGITDRWIINIKKSFSGVRFNAIEKIAYRNYECTTDIHVNPVIENEVVTGVSIYIRNITHIILQKQLLEKELAEKNRLAVIPHKTGSAIIVTDTTFRITWANENFAALCGYSSMECQGRKTRDLLGSAYFDNTSSIELENLLENGNAITICNSFTLKTGEQKWISSNITPLCNAKGVCEEFIIIKTDITSLKKQEEMLQNAYDETRKMALVAHHSDISVLITDKRNCIEWVNDGFIKMFGYQSQYCQGKQPFHLFSGPNGQHSSSRFDDKIASCRNFTFETHVYRNDSTQCWVSFNVTPYFNEKDELEKYIYIISEITARKDEEEQIRKLLVQDKERIWINTGIADLSDVLRNSQENEEQLYVNTLKFMTAFTGASFAQVKLAHSSGDKDSGLPMASNGMLMKDHKQVNDYSIDYLSIIKTGFEIFREHNFSHYSINNGEGFQALQEIFCVKIGSNKRSVLILSLYASKNFTPLQTEFIHRATETISQTIELFKRKKDTESLLEETQLLNQRLNSRGEELKTTIAELNRQSKELHQSQSELELQNRKLSDKTTELEGTREDLHVKAKQLEQSNRFKTEFLANMSHELRTPLNSIIILSRLLQENKESTLTPKQMEFARIVNKSGDDLLSLINDILDLSKIEAGRIELELSEVELGEIADDMMNLFNEVAREKRINFAVSMQQGITKTIFTDKARAGQVIKNLLSNAFKFTPDLGSVHLNIKSTKENIEFEVTDTGSGIAPEKQQIIFEAFRQADGSINRKYGGTGLGLSISRELATMLNGKLTLKSTPGQGSTFTLSIPVNKENDDSDSTEKFIALIVEDNETENHAIRFVLSKQGYHCISSYTVHDAMKQLSAGRIHALILDLNLPDGNGVDILKHVKETPALTGISIIIYTSRDLEPVEKELLKAYSNTVIKKENKSIITLQEETIRFLQKLPLRKSADVSEHKTAKPETPQLKGKNILIVDDDERNIFAITHTLEGQNVNIYKAATGKEALLQLKLNPEIDLVLMDVMMPEMDGIETVKIIRTETDHKNVPIIAVTAKAMTHDREICLSAGMNEYVTKPIDTNQLLFVMNSFFQ